MPVTPGDYYSRSATTFIDGTPIFKSSEDEANEHSVSSMITDSWGCECRSLGKLAPIDWVFMRSGRLVGVGELKSRSHKKSAYPTVFLNLRKWLALSLAQVGLGVPAVFVVKFTDAACWVPLNDIDAAKITLGGCRKTVKSRNDIEPVIEVPCDRLKPISTIR